MFDSCGAEEMNPDDSDDLLTFPVAPPCVVLSEMSQKLIRINVKTKNKKYIKSKKYKELNHEQ